MENKAHALAAGTFVVLLTLLLAAMGWWLMRDGGLQRTYEISSPYPVTGLNVQAAVRLKGVPVGKVTAIEFDPKTPGNVLVRISVDARTPITRSTWATLGYQGVTGIAHIALNDDGRSSEPLTATDDGPPRIPLRPGAVGQVLDEGQRLLAQLQEAATRVNALLAPQNQQALLRAVGQAGDAAAGLRRLSDDLHAFMTGAGAASQASLPALAQDTRATLRALQATLEETRGALTEARAALRGIGGEGGAGEQLAASARALGELARTLDTETLPRVNRLADEAARASRELARASAGVADNPQALLYGHGPIPPGPGERAAAAP